MSGVLILVLFAAALLAIVGVGIPLAFRKVVETNKVHIVQGRTKTTSYGAGQAAGNVYYLWPSWMPVLGVTRIVLPVNNFELPLKDYEAYDKERLPFSLDVVSFFRISDTNMAAARIANFEDLKAQLGEVLKGAVRKILASHDIHQIMTDRATFGEQFTKEVSEELKNWGVEPVKNMELMDIRDSKESKVIANIMSIKASQIEMESRTAVATNKQKARTAEIDAERTVQVSEQSAAEDVGKRTAQTEQAVGIAKQLSQQEVAEAEVLTVTKRKAVERESAVKQAELEKAAALVRADQEKQTAILVAEGALEATKREAEGVRATGEAKADAEKAMLTAPVDAQIKLAKEIGENERYQTYLIQIEQVKATVEVGIAQAKALQAADVKVIANAGSATSGIKSAMELFSPQGGLALGGMLEALKNTPEGEKLLKVFTDTAVPPLPSKKGDKNGVSA